MIPEYTAIGAVYAPKRRDNGYYFKILIIQLDPRLETQ